VGLTKSKGWNREGPAAFERVINTTTRIKMGMVDGTRERCVLRGDGGEGKKGSLNEVFELLSGRESVLNEKQTIGILENRDLGV